MEVPANLGERGRSGSAARLEGGPGATGRSFSSRETIEQSIRERLFQLPDGTVVHTGHGPDTTIGAEKKAAQGDWL